MIVFGKEPTCHEKLTEIMRLLSSRQNSISLYTNGIRICDRAYLRELKKSHLDKIYLQFDGFRESTYSTLRKSEMLGIKAEALDNLRKENIATVLNVALVEENEDQIMPILDYAVKNDFVRTVNFTSYIRSGFGREFLSGCSIMPDGLVDKVEKGSGGRVNRASVFLFQKLLYAYMSFQNKRTCPYIQYYWLYRSGKGYLPIDSLIDLKGMERFWIGIKTSSGRIPYWQNCI